MLNKVLQSFYFSHIDKVLVIGSKEKRKKKVEKRERMGIQEIEGIEKKVVSTITT